MPCGSSHLSHQAVLVLEMIAAGSSYEQILAALPHLTYIDIFDAAREALDLSVIDRNPPKVTEGFASIRAAHPRAYERWTDADDNLLRRLAGDGISVARIANRLQRQRSAIRSRLLKLNLDGLLNPSEQSELHRISELDPKDPAEDGTETGDHGGEIESSQ